MSERCGIHAYRYVWATYLTFSVTSVETFWNMPAGNWIPPVCPAFKPCYILTGRNCWLGVASKKGRATKCLEKLFSRKVVIWQKVEAVASVTNSCLLRATGVSFYGSLSVEVHLRWCTDAVIFKSEWRNFDNYEVQQRTVQTSWRSFDEVPHPFRVLALFFGVFEELPSADLSAVAARTSCPQWDAPVASPPRRTSTMCSYGTPFTAGGCLNRPVGCSW